MNGLHSTVSCSHCLQLTRHDQRLHLLGTGEDSTNYKPWNALRYLTEFSVAFGLQPKRLAI